MCVCIYICIIGMRVYIYKIYISPGYQFFIRYIYIYLYLYIYIKIFSSNL